MLFGCLYMFSQLWLCSAKLICFYCQIFQIWLLIQWVVGSVVGGSVLDWLVGLVVRGFNKTQEKTCLGWRFRLCTLVEVYFVDLILFFFHSNGTEKANLTAGSSHSNVLFLKIYKYYNFKQKVRAYWNFIKYLFHL